MKKVLVIIDMQNDFIDGSLGTKEAQVIVPKIVEKIKSFDGLIYITMDTHEKDYLDTQEGKNLPIKHCIYKTYGWNLNNEISSEIHAYSNYLKPTFGSIELANDLVYNFKTRTDLDEIILVGLCTDICVISNALLLKAFLPEVKITVDASCCAGVTPESHKNALEAMKMCQINIINE